VGVRLRGLRDGVPVTLTGGGHLVSQSSDSALSFIERLWAARRIAELTVQMDQNGESEELLTELLELSKRHGILTPWTSFLADERNSLDATTALPQLRGAIQEQAKRVSGAGAIHSRSALQKLAAAAGSAPPPQPIGLGGIADAGRPTGGLSGGGGGQAGQMPELDARFQTPRSVGGRTFFWKDGCWQDVTLNSEDRRLAKRVEVFSDEYFELAGDAEAALWLSAFGAEPILFRRGDTLYLIEAAKAQSGSNNK